MTLDADKALQGRRSPTLVFCLGAGGGFLLAASLAMGFAAVRPGLVRTTTQKPPEWFRSSMTRFHRRVDASVPSGAVLFFGDSHIQGLCVAAVADGAVNFGIGGDTAAGLLDRLASYRSVEHARAVVVCVGYNDIANRSDDEILGDIKRIVDAIPHHVPVVLSELLPVDEGIRGADVNSRIAALNRSIREGVGADPRVTISPTRQVADASGSLEDEHHGGDGLHLSPKGYSIWIKALRAAVAKAKESGA